MRFNTTALATVIATAASTLTFWSCGQKDDGSTSVYYQSCVVPIVIASTDLGFCIESKNSTDLKPSCDQNNGTYAQTQCTVPVGTKGCSYANSNGVSLTDWYTGASWTAEQATTTCTADGKNGTVITKE